MKRKIGALAALLFAGSILVSPPLNAATEGCPITWSIDTSTATGIDDLFRAKNRLQSDMAIDDGQFVYSNYAGVFGQMKVPAVQKLSAEDSVLYGYTQVQKRYTVQVKNCPEKVQFTFNLGRFAQKDLNMNVDPSQWASQNQSYFEDFTKADQFGQCLINLQNGVSSPRNYNVEKVGSKLNFLIINYLSIGRTKCGLRIPIVLNHLSESCRWINLDAAPLWMGVTMPIGGKCDVAFAVGKDVFPKFTIDSNRWRTAITCTKGKQVKKVSGLIGYEFELKCPAGFRKKI